jgi:hypothetical protein
MVEKLKDKSEPFKESADKLADVCSLESSTWAPWLTFNHAQLARHREVYPAGQFEIRDHDQTLQGILSTNRVNWNGDIKELKTWDDLAGPDLTYEDTYLPDGNTLALMSISIDPNTKGKGLYKRLIRQAQDFSRTNNLEHLIGDFRPSGFGAYKRNTGNFDFDDYCKTTRADNYPHHILKRDKAKNDNLPQDPWLRAVKKIGMNELISDARAMVVPTSIEEFESYLNNYKPENWWNVTSAEDIKYLLDWHQPNLDLDRVEEVWECGETGTWYVDRINSKAVYIESNLWGELPIRTERYDLNEDEMSGEEKKLVQRVWAENKKEENVQSVWLSTYSTSSNIVRSWESKYYPEISEVVDDEAERHSAFLAIVDNRLNQKKIVHTARVTSPNLASDTSLNTNERTYFASIDELIEAGLFTTQELRDYYTQLGIDVDSCISVETNQRIGEKAERFNGLGTAEIAYLTFFRLLAANNPDLGKTGIFANINRASYLSFARFGLKFENLLGREDLKFSVNGSEKDYYRPIFIPYIEENIALFRSIDSQIPEELTFDI